MPEMQAGRDLYVAGRDLIIHQHLDRSFEIVGGLYQLPPDIADFTGREEAMRRLESWLTGPAGTIVLSAISGMGGVGKTALAVRLAHRLKGAFPDGQLYVNLRGVEAERLDPSDVLAGFLRAFGVQGSAIPEGLDERATFYRGLLEGRRVLVVLDNAASEAQVRPLLPAASGCAALITSRARLPALEGARGYNLDVLTSEAATELFTKIVGAERARAEPDAVERLVGLCGRLPLAIRIIAARLAARPHWRLARMLARLEDQHRRLEELKVGDLSVRASFALSYAALAEEEQSAFRLLGLVQAPDFPAWVLAAVLGSDLAEAEDVIERLAEVQLLETTGEDSTGQLRFRFHDLLRSFARERLRDDAPPDDVLERMLGAYLALSKRALYLMSPNSKRDALAPRARMWLPDDLDPDSVIGPRPMDWFVAEEVGIVAAVGQAYEHRLWDITWELADPLHYHFRVLARWADWVATHELALEAARLAGNRRGEACILRNLGNVYKDQGRPVEAIACYQAGLVIATELDSTLLSAFMLNGLGEVCLDRGRMTDAGAYFERSLPAWASIDDLTGVAYTHTHLAMVYIHQGRLSEAMEQAERSLAMQREFRDRSGESYALTAIGDVHRLHGRLESAVSCYEQVLHTAREQGADLSEADALVRLAWVRREQGDIGAAKAAFTQALPVFLEYGQRRGEAETLAGLGAIESDEGNLSDGIQRLDQALGVAEELDDVLSQGRLLVLLGHAHLAAGDRSAATERWRLARERFHEAGAAREEEARELLSGL
ncbi:Predicted ATPase [Thermomonospora echinospora]|uniref:Predicted ATPase n=1 Tax=Thermomonospora echinospora TaxID=1992 RepID=A0A1H6DPQ6_9ACTN|nr:tetratricopeptide repeat protein [Thermomonospora echinospora]SEG86545.1 Predicted ATPase [Thermomonospora echinospora]